MDNFPANRSSLYPFIIGLVCLMTSTGCNSQPSTVKATGKVILDSKPVSNAEVLFESLEKNGFSAMGITDTNGIFNLKLADGVLGIVPGNYHVSITTFKRGDPKEGIPDTPEIIPVEYNERSNVEVTVTSENNNQFNFEIEKQKQNSKTNSKWRK